MSPFKHKLKKQNKISIHSEYDLKKRMDKYDPLDTRIYDMSITAFYTTAVSQIYGHNLK